MGFFCLGTFLMQREISKESHHILLFLEPGQTSLKGWVVDEPYVYQKGKMTKHRFDFEAELHGKTETIRATLVNVQGNVVKGDELVLVGKLRENKSRFSRARFNFLGIGRKSYFILSENNSFLWPFENLRRELIHRFQDLLPDPEAPIFQAMILGDRSSLSRDWKDRFSRLGIIHILSVSGFHMAVAGFFLYGVGRLLFLGPTRSMVLVIIGLTLYYFLAGGRAPSFRALLMATAFLGGRFIGREGNGLNALCFAFMIALFIDPRELFSLSFQLSYLVVMGIILSFMFFRLEIPLTKKRAVSRLLHHCLDLFKISIFCYLFAYGLVAYAFGKLSLLTILINFVFSPLFSLLIILGLLLSVGALMGDGIGGLFSLFAYIPSHFLLEEFLT